MVCAAVVVVPSVVAPVVVVEGEFPAHAVSITDDRISVSEMIVNRNLFICCLLLDFL